MSSPHAGPGQKLFEFLASGLMEVQTQKGSEMREVAHFDFDNMLRTPQLNDGELHVPTIGGVHYIVRTE